VDSPDVQDIASLAVVSRGRSWLQKKIRSLVTSNDTPAGFAFLLNTFIAHTEFSDSTGSAGGGGGAAQFQSVRRRYGFGLPVDEMLMQPTFSP